MRGTECVILAGLRSPFGAFQGALAGLDPLASVAGLIDRLLERSSVQPAQVDALYLGIGLHGASSLTATRQVLLQSGLPETLPSLGVDRACCSGMTAIGLAAKDIRLGEAELIVAGGFDFLSQAPYLLPRGMVRRPGDLIGEDPLLLRARFMDSSIAAYTSAEALRAGVDREAQDAWAHRSHQRYVQAFAAGRFTDEIITLGGLERDEAVRFNSSAAALAALPTVRGTQTITAGNAPGLSDGAALLLIASRGFAERHSLAPLARIGDYVQVADGPTSGSRTPAIAIRALLERNRIALDALERIEINEAFAATPLVSTLVLADGDKTVVQALRQRTNIDGGAVAIGHPLGASGARLALHLALAIQRDRLKSAAAAICGGFGQGDSLLLTAV